MMIGVVEACGPAPVRGPAAVEVAMNCPFLRAENLICSAATKSLEHAYVPSGIELDELCKSNRYTLCYIYFMNKDAKNDQ